MLHLARWKLPFVVGLALLMATLVALQVDGVTGPSLWHWAWRRINAWPIFTSFGIAALPAFAAQWLFCAEASGRVRRASAIALLMLTCFGLKISSAIFVVMPPRLQLIEATVENPDVTSYYTVAAALWQRPVREWMPGYAPLMRAMPLHAQTKPPGPVLYWLAIVRAAGGPGETAALAGGLLLGALATLAIPATYGFILYFGDRDRDAAFAGASFLALCPGFVLFFPMMDPAYILLSVPMLVLWHGALQRDRLVCSIALGLVLAGAAVVTFNIFVIGMLMLAMIFITAPQRRFSHRLGFGAKHGVAAALAAITSLALLWIAIGYNPVEVFAAAFRNQHLLLSQHPEMRPYPQTIPFDLTDFALGSGWISIVLAAFYFLRADPDRDRRRFAILCIAQLVATAATGLLQLETARVWCFMLPLLMLPIGLELGQWPAWARGLVVALLALLCAVIYQNVKLIY